MTKYKSQGFVKTFKNAGKGVRMSIKSERNIRVHILIGVIVLFAAFYLKFSVVKISVILLAAGSVISAEMLNSAIEFALDSIYHNKYSKMVGIAKDIAAGAVMTVTFIAITIGIILFLPPIFETILR